MADKPKSNKKRRAANESRKPRTSSSPTPSNELHGPPVQVTAEGVEAHPHRTGHWRTDRLIAGAAIFMSLLSLLVAYKHGLIMRDLVSASSWPLLQFESGNVDDENDRLSISLVVRNAGVGPAIVKDFTVYYAGKPYKNPYLLMRDCCGYVVADPDPTNLAPGSPVSRPIEDTVIKAGDSTTYFQMDLAAANRSAWLKIDEARFKLRVDACYCSVLGDCWQSDLIGVEPKRVERCSPSARGSSS